MATTETKYTCQIQGRYYLKYAGALAEALDRGLTTLEVDLIQIPSEANGNTAICKATAILEGEGRTLRVVEWGDASPTNTAPMVRNALIRMAATRAKGRALRDLIGHGEALAEEIGEGEISDARHGKESTGNVRESFCVECGIELTPGQIKLSRAKYGGSYCPAHQKTAVAA